jgi:hypothetical protein
MNLCAASRGVPSKVKYILSQPRWAGFPLRYNKLLGIKPCKFRITLKVVGVIRVICEIGGLKIINKSFVFKGPCAEVD